jgi:NADH-quinone oxidoreductase subunit N
MIALVTVLLTAIITLFVNLVNTKWSRPVATLGLAVALGVCFYDFSNPYEDASEMLYFSHASTIFSALTILIGLILVGTSEYSITYAGKNRGDVYALMLFSICGALILFAYSNLLMLFLGVEILSIPLYVLAGSDKDNLASNESSLKYFLQGAFATGILLFGIALIYGASGSFFIGGSKANNIINYQLYSGGGLTMFNMGVFMMMFGLAFKIAAAPFHFWSADVYEGAPDLITSFMATVVKTAGIVAITIFLLSIGFLNKQWEMTFAIMAGLSLVVGNFSALKQMSFKRTLAYSSISHAGYLMLGITINDPIIIPTLLFYLLAYSLSTLVLMIGMSWVAGHTGKHDFTAFNGLAKKHPFLAGLMAVAMLSMAGLPPLSGFFGKYFIFAEVFNQGALSKDGGFWWLVLVAAINSVISIYYYFRIIIAMFFSPAISEEEVPAMPRVNLFVLGLMCLGLLLAPLFATQLYGLMFY